jgi:hypothetical protein
LNTAFCCSLSTVLSESDTFDSAVQEHGLFAKDSDCNARDSNFTQSDCVSDDPISPNASSLVSVSSLSTISSCSEHSVRIEQRHVMINGHSLTETQLIPDDKNNSACCFEPAGIIEQENGCKLTECRYLSESHLMWSDWREASQLCIDTAEEKLCVLPQVKKMSNVQLRAKLTEYGESPGPVTASTRRTLEQRLCSYMTGEAHVKQQSGKGSTLLGFSCALGVDYEFLSWLALTSLGLFYARRDNGELFSTSKVM